MAKKPSYISPWQTAGCGLLLMLLLSLAGCSSPGPDKSEIANFQRERAEKARTKELNQKMMMKAQSEEQGASEEKSADNYHLGPGDMLDIVVLGVPELNRKARIDGNGVIGLPLIGEVEVGGLTVDDASELIAKRYEKSYLKDPQVSVLIEEYRSQQITVLGAVNNPEVYAVQREMSLLGVLAMAGGVRDDASGTVYVTDWVQDPKTNKRTRRNMVVSLDELVEGNGQDDFKLGNEAVVNVPSAGVVYVEGAVEEPGAYDLKGDTTVLKAIAMAGGTLFEADESGLKLLRLQQEGNKKGQFEPVQFDLESLRTNPSNDVALQDGDIVVVEADEFQSALMTLIDTTRGFFGIGYGL